MSDVTYSFQQRLVVGLPVADVQALVEQQVAVALVDSTTVMTYIPDALQGAIRAGISTADVTTYIQEAVNAASYVTAPTGTYNISQVTIPAGHTLAFDGEAGSTIIVPTSPTLDVFILNNRSSLTGARIISSGQTASAMIRIDGSYATVEHYELNGCSTGIHISYSVLNTTRIRRGRIFNIQPVTGIGIFNEGYADGLIEDLWMDGTNGSTNHALRCAAGIKVTSAADLVMNSLNIINTGVALNIDAQPGRACDSINVFGSYFDSSNNSATITGNGGNINRLNFVNTWFGNSISDGVTISNPGGGSVNGVKFVNPAVYLNGGSGIKWSSGVFAVSILGGAFAGNGGTAIAPQDNTGYFSIIGAAVGPVDGLGPNGIGILIPATCTDALICANTIYGNTTFNLNNAAMATRTVTVTGNLGGQNTLVVGDAFTGEGYRLGRNATDGFMELTADQAGTFNGYRFLTRTAEGTLIPRVEISSGGPMSLLAYPSLGSYANDAAAAIAGVPVGQLYRNGSVIQVRVA